MLAPLARLLSPAGKSARLTVLIFHRVLAEPDPLFPEEVCARRFDQICGWLSEWFNVLPLDNAAVRLQAGTLPARAACITFDDGYADNHDIALPILRRHGLSATFFIATGFLDGGRMWNDSIIETIRRCESALDLSAEGLGVYPVGSNALRRQAAQALIAQVKYRPVQDRHELVSRIAAAGRVALPDDLMMSSGQVAKLRRAGMNIGGHTVSHPILAVMDDQAAVQEIRAGRAVLQDIIGEPVTLFAYPNGKPGEDYSARTVELVRNEGFEAAVSTSWGASRHGDDPFQIKRFTPWDRTRLGFGFRLLHNLRA